MRLLVFLLNFPDAVRADYVRRLRREAPEAEIELAATVGELERKLGDAEVLLTFGIPEMRDAFRHARRLRWVHILGSGTDGILDAPALPAGVPVTATRGIHAPAMTEHVFLLMLALGRRFARMVKNQERHVWERWPSPVLAGKTVGILGIGHVGQALAARCRAFGLKVVGISDFHRALAGFDRIEGRAALSGIARDLDYLVCLLPLSEETRSFVDARVFGAMKPGAYFINVSRGGVVNEADLVAALNGKTIAGAGIDVFAEEPLPPDSPLWDVPNLLLTPHLAASSDTYISDAVALFAANLRHFSEGAADRMTHIVSTQPADRTHERPKARKEAI